MHYLFAIPAALVSGMIILMVGILVTREPEQSLQSAFHEGLAWGIGLILSFSAEILMSAYV